MKYLCGGGEHCEDGRATLVEYVFKKWRTLILGCIGKASKWGRDGCGL